MTGRDAAAAPSAGERMIARLYSITEAAEMLNVPRTWLRDKVTARAVPHARLGRHVRFSDDHLVSIINLGERNPPERSALSPSQTGRRRRRRA